MRRPVKPFVTEYRGGSRRPPGPGQSPKNDPFKEPEFRAVEAWPTPPPVVPYAASQQQEDSYEAALRAADSLFAGVRRVDPQAESQPAGDASSAAHPSGGRVLRVLDEPPSQEVEEMMRLEAEFAPKKRGRKPGSKNKPKPALVGYVGDAPAPIASVRPAMTAATTFAAPIADVEPVVAKPIGADGFEADSHVAESFVPKTLVARTLVAKTLVPKSFVPRTVVATKTVAALAPDAVPAGPRGERYAWVRTRLKPGQQWKRRLPKVAW